MESTRRKFLKQAIGVAGAALVPFEAASKIFGFPVPEKGEKISPAGVSVVKELEGEQRRVAGGKVSSYDAFHAAYYFHCKPKHRAKLVERTIMANVRAKAKSLGISPEHFPILVAAKCKMCGELAEYKTLADFPLKDVKCGCSNGWMVKFDNSKESDYLDEEEEALWG